MANLLINPNGAAAGTVTSTKVSTQQTTINQLQAIIAASAAYMPPAALATLQAQINALLQQQQANKQTLQSTVYNVILNAGRGGITKANLVQAVCIPLQGVNNTPFTTAQITNIISCVTNVNWFVQQSFYSKQVPAWPMVTKNINGVTKYSFKCTQVLITQRLQNNTGLANRYNQFCAYYRAPQKVFSVPINNSKVVITAK